MLCCEWFVVKPFRPCNRRQMSSRSGQRIALYCARTKALGSIAHISSSVTPCC